MKDFVKRGYPHEIISWALSRVDSILQGKYRKRTKAITRLFLILSKKSNKLKLTKIQDKYARYYYLASQKHNKSLIQDYKSELSNLIESYESSKSRPIYNQLVDLLALGLYLHLILNQQIFDNSYIEKLLKILSSSEEATFLKAIQYLNSKVRPNEQEIASIIKTFSSTDKQHLYECGILLSFLLATQLLEYKKEFLSTHYNLIEKFENKFHSIIENKNLDDTAIETIFRLSIVLYICGYSSSICLPKQEKLNYLQHMIGHKPIVEEVREHYQNLSKWNILILALSLGLLIIHKFYEWNQPISLNLGFVGIEIPFNLPVLYFSGIIALGYFGYRTLRLKYLLIKRLEES